MISLGASAFLFIAIAILVSLVSLVIVTKLIDMIFNTSLIPMGVNFLLIIVIELLTAYWSYSFMTDIVLKRAAFETTSKGTIIAINDKSITYTDNETGEMNSIDYDTDYKIKPKLDKNLKSGEIKIITHSSDWGSYKEVTYNIPKK